jgi:CRP-like cAMP-binding protein
MSEKPYQSKVHFSAGQTIFREGETGETMYYILSGAVQIVKNFVGVEREVNVLEPGDFFGEIAILHQRPRAASARAKTDVELAEVTSRNFEGMLTLDVEIPIRMLRSLSESLRHSQRELALALTLLSEKGRQRFEQSAQSLHAPVPASAGPPLAHLFLEDWSKTWPIPATGARIGRQDRVTGITPEVDLGELTGGDSVARSHAWVRFEENGFTLSEEIGVGGGTMIDEQRLDPGVRYPLRDGSRIRLGEVMVVFRMAPSTEGGR